MLLTFAFALLAREMGCPVSGLDRVPIAPVGDRAPAAVPEWVICMR